MKYGYRCNNCRFEFDSRTFLSYPSLCKDCRPKETMQVKSCSPETKDTRRLNKNPITTDEILDFHTKDIKI